MAPVLSKPLAQVRALIRQTYHSSSILICFDFLEILDDWPEDTEVWFRLDQMARQPPKRYLQWPIRYADRKFILGVIY
jgi:hypothetical protein